MMHKLSQKVANPTITTLARTFNVQPWAPVIIPGAEKNFSSGKVYDGKLPAQPTPDPKLYDSPLGTPVFSDITFSSVTYTDSVSGQQVSTPEFKQALALFKVTQPKDVVFTQINNRSGRVHEYIGLDDWHLTINGILVAPNGQAPTTDIGTLRNICAAPVAIPVVSTYLNNLGIHSIIITELSMDQEPGGYSKQAYTMTCVSETPIQLMIF